MEKHALFNSVASLSFSDRESSNSAETEVTRETSAERSLSVSELDPDSLVIQPSGCIWQMEELVATVYGSQLGSTKLKITDSKQKLQTSSHLKVSLPGLAITQHKLNEQQQSKANKKFNLEAEARYIVTPGTNGVR